MLVRVAVRNCTPLVLCRVQLIREVHWVQRHGLLQRTGRLLAVLPVRPALHFGVRRHVI